MFLIIVGLSQSAGNSLADEFGQPNVSLGDEMHHRWMFPLDKFLMKEPKGGRSGVYYTIYNHVFEDRTEHAKVLPGQIAISIQKVVARQYVTEYIAGIFVQCDADVFVQTGESSSRSFHLGYLQLEGRSGVDKFINLIRGLKFTAAEDSSVADVVKAVLPIIGSDLTMIGNELSVIADQFEIDGPSRFSEFRGNLPEVNGRSYNLIYSGVEIKISLELKSVVVITP